MSEPSQEDVYEACKYAREVAGDILDLLDKRSPPVNIHASLLATMRVLCLILASLPKSNRDMMVNGIKNQIEGIINDFSTQMESDNASSIPS